MNSFSAKKMGRKLGVSSLFCLLLMLCLPSIAQAYEVEADSLGNQVFILLTNGNPAASFDTITVSNNAPGMVSSATASIIPTSVAINSSDLAALDFDIASSAALGTSGDLIVTVSGQADGQAVDVVVTVPLTVVASAPSAQGFIGSTIPAPDPGGFDSDSDGVTDALEIAYGSDPNDASWLPGQIVEENIPLLGVIGTILLAALFLGVGSSAARRQKMSVLVLAVVMFVPLNMLAGSATRIQVVASIPTPPPPPPEPVLLSATASSSSNESAALPPSDAVDGSMGTRWSSQFTNNQWLTLDLGATYSLSEVIIHWEAANAASYELQGSNDFSSWTTLASESGGASGARTDTVTVAGNYRYVRMQGLTRNTVYGYSIYEMEVLGLPAADEDEDGIGDSSDQCPGTPAGSSVDSAGCPAPDVFSFTPIVNAPLNTLTVSNPITVSSISGNTSISIEGGQYSINGGTYGSNSGFVANGNTVVVRQTSSVSYSDTSQTTLTIGGLSASFAVTTVSDQNLFGFVNQTNAAQNMVVTSNAVVVSGLSGPTAISVSNGEYSIDGSAYTNAAGTIANGQILSLQQQTSPLLATQLDTLLSLGGSTDAFSVTTSATQIPIDQSRTGNLAGVTVWQLPNAPNGDRPDQCWLAVGSDIDGDIYISGHDHINNSMLYRLHQSDSVIRWVGDAETASEAVNNWSPGETAEKFHTRPLYHDGRVYAATLDSSNMNTDYLNTRGFHWYGYDLFGNELLDLSVSEPQGVGAPNIQIVTIQKDTNNDLLYGMSIPENKLVRYDIANKQTTVLGKPSSWNGYFYSNRFMWVDSRDRVYITGGSSRGQWNQGEPASVFDHVWYYDPATGFGELPSFQMQGPNAIEVGQWDRAHEVLYVADDQGNIYRFVDATASWSFVGQPNFTGVPGTPKTWVFQLSADDEKIYIGVSDSSYPNSIWEYDIATNTTSELAKVSELDTQASSQQFITGYDSWDDRGRFYFSSFSMYNGVNVYMLGVDPVRIKAANDSFFELVAVSAQSTVNGVSITRSGTTTQTLEVLYQVKLFNALGDKLETIIGETTIIIGQNTRALSTANLGLPLAGTYSYAEFSLVADGNDYILADNFTTLLP